MLYQSIEETIDILYTGLSPFLQGMGFNLKKNRSFVKKMKECTQEMNIQFRRIKGQEAGYISVFPNIIFENVERLVAVLSEENYKKGWPTAAANIGNLQSNREYIEWPITLTSNVPDLTKIITNLIERIAKPFWEDFSSLNNLIQGYEDCDPRLILNGPSYKWSLTAAYCLIEEYEKAINTLNNWEIGRPSEVLIEKSINKIYELWREQ